MADLRDALSGFGDVRTYLQSGNAVISSDRSPEEARAECERLIERRFGFHVDVLLRTGDELTAVVRRNPLVEVADNPKRYQVSFLEREPDPALFASLVQLAVGAESYELIGRELYAWHPEGVSRSRFWAKLAAGGLGVLATSRNWTTVTALAEMAAAQ